MDMHARCVSILANLWGAQKGEQAIGSATTGSSEAIHLGGLAMKRRWQEKRRAEGKDTSKPNIIMGANAQVALEKFARYFEVEARILPVSAKSRYRLDPELVRENIDENTIGVFVILGSTYTGHYEPVEEISDILDEFEKKTGYDIPIHVDGASGAFIAPFTHAQAGFKWNFELPRVKSINVSGHKLFVFQSLLYNLKANTLVAALFTLELAGSSGETNSTSPTTSSLSFTTWEAPKRVTRSIFLAREDKLSPSITI
jgi:glutamate decarboxylase